VNEKIDIPQETNLKIVRERSQEPHQEAPQQDADQAGRPRRTYKRRNLINALEMPTAGAAVDVF
jgi:hypothetical protein